MVNGVPREVPSPKPEGPQAVGLTQGTPFTMIHPRLFHTFSFFCHPGPEKRDFFQPMVSLGTPLVIMQGMDFYIGRVRSQFAGLGCRKNAQFTEFRAAHFNAHYCKLYCTL